MSTVCLFGLDEFDVQSLDDAEFIEDTVVGWTRREPRLAAKVFNEVG